MRILQKLLPDVTLIELPSHVDERGSFVKFFNNNSFQHLGLNFQPAESFFTVSNANVIRGMHFQTGKASHSKLVYCMNGRILDVVVDIRPDSPQFNQPVAVELNKFDSVGLLIGKGYAHGFLALEGESCLLYSTSTVYSPDQDRGVLWSSINFKWPVDCPILSQRDTQHPFINHLK